MLIRVPGLRCKAFPFRSPQNVTTARPQFVRLRSLDIIDSYYNQQLGVYGDRDHGSEPQAGEEGSAAANLFLAEEREAPVEAFVSLTRSQAVEMISTACH